MAGLCDRWRGLWKAHGSAIMASGGIVVSLALGIDHATVDNLAKLTNSHLIADIVRMTGNVLIYGGILFRSYFTARKLIAQAIARGQQQMTP